MQKRIIGLNITIGEYQKVLEDIVSMARNKTSGFVCFVNVHMVIEAYWNKKLNEGINQARILSPDGVPVAKSLEFLYGLKQDRISGMDSLPALMQLAEKEALSVYFFGSSNQILTKIEKRAHNEFPNLKIAGAFSPPFDKPLNSESYIQDINDSGADLVFVALGCPKQEKWMIDNVRDIKAVLLGVGGAFSVYAGMQARAPEWMQKCGLEWLYRLIQEPGRLWKRYFVTNSLFLVLITMEKIKLIIGRLTKRTQLG
ncbi:WecB/TagA/CpsF family glycosyltransferase [Fulvivirgaceae bacterium BMA10]|uniref:WecB/TagA/CpsF family glycosyltransferase n=1 Tax=Splendidivirga corallicola TaxID=3051826 RepID=A0ABT8KLN6_9BACT|nr:WecB/TagA/CpsF family glycosyltransferase [Fulvivirgaceae bacterium BMA10]